MLRQRQAQAIGLALSASKRSALPYLPIAAWRRRDFRLHGIEVEARALLHRRELDRGQGQLLDLLLDEHEAPEFVFEPIEVLLRPVLWSRSSGQPGALERIEAEVVQRMGQVGFDLPAAPAIAGAGR